MDCLCWFLQECFKRKSVDKTTGDATTLLVSQQCHSEDTSICIQLQPRSLPLPHTLLSVFFSCNWCKFSFRGASIAFTLDTCFIDSRSVLAFDRLSQQVKLDFIFITSLVVRVKL